MIKTGIYQNPSVLFINRRSDIFSKFHEKHDPTENTGTSILKLDNETVQSTRKVMMKLNMKDHIPKVRIKYPFQKKIDLSEIDFMTLLNQNCYRPYIQPFESFSEKTNSWIRELPEV